MTLSSSEVPDNSNDPLLVFSAVDFLRESGFFKISFSSFRLRFYGDVTKTRYKVWQVVVDLSHVIVYDTIETRENQSGLCPSTAAAAARRALLLGRLNAESAKHACARAECVRRDFWSYRRVSRPPVVCSILSGRRAKIRALSYNNDCHAFLFAFYRRFRRPQSELSARPGHVRPPESVRTYTHR